jgi:MoxR-like ATPase
MDEVQPVLGREELLEMQTRTEQVFVKDEIAEYIVSLIEKTRVSEYLTQGISPRGSIALMRMAKAHAFYMDRDFVTPEDIHAVFHSTCNHRLILNTKAKAAGFDSEKVLDQVFASVPIPKLSLS